MKQSTEKMLKSHI